MNNIITIIRKRFSRGDHELFGLIEEKKRLINCIQNTYKNGLSESIVLCGKKGTGKSHLIRSVLTDLSIDENFRKNMSVVHLNGLIQTDDRMAIKSIGQQLKVTFDDDENEILTSQRINDTLHYILKVMSSGHGASISLLFIIEEFDLFLKNRNQMLIYNLVNCVQSIATSICVIGLTTRLDVVELMEKRVTSRFSRCHINLSTYSETFALYLTAANRLLSVKSDDNIPKSVTNKWNKSVEKFLNDLTVQKILEENFMLSNTISRLKLILMVPIARLSDTKTCLDVRDLEESWKRMCVNYKTELLKGLSEMEFTFVCVMVKCADIKEGDINFEMVYKDYQTFCYDVGIKALEKGAMKKCLQNLIDMQLVAVKRVANVSVNYQDMQCYVHRDDLKLCVKCREISTTLQSYIQVL